MKVTIKQIAHEAGVSKSTVSKYLNGGNVEPEYRKAVDLAIENLGGFYPNLLAKGLKTSTSFTIGVMVPHINDNFSATIVAGIEHVLQERGYGVIVCSYGAQRETFRQKLRFLVGKMIDGLVVFPSGIEKDDFQFAPAKNIPLVFVDRPVQGVEADVVMTDSVSVCRDVVRHLLDMGHRKIAVLTGSVTSYSSSQRILGCEKAVEEYGLSKDTLIIAHSITNVENGYRGAMELLDRNDDITAVFCTNYYLTFGAISALNMRGVPIPEKMSFVGFDTSDLYGAFPYQLTTVEQNIEQLGTRAAQMIFDRLAKDSSDEHSVVAIDARINYGNSIKQVNRIG